MAKRIHLDEQAILRRIRYRVAYRCWPAVARVVWWDEVDRTDKGRRKYPKGLSLLLLEMGVPFRAGQRTRLSEIEAGLRAYGYSAERAYSRVHGGGSGKRRKAEDE